MAVTDDLPVEKERTVGGFRSLGSAIRFLIVAWAAVIASFPLNDNSFFTHLATGRLILESGSVPSADPYTFTALGVDWTVQSWLMSVTYAGAERLGGAFGVRLLVLVTFVVAALLVWRLSRPADSILARLIVVSIAMFVATGLWAERPYMVGVIGMGVVWLALDGAVRTWLLVPMMWVWANSHGSYPLAIILVLCVIAGEALDRRRDEKTVGRGREALRSGLHTELSVLAAVIGGTLLAMIGPLGVDVLLFPVKALSQSDVLSTIVEWQPPGFRSVPERMFLVLAVAALAGLVRVGRWRLALPTLVFVAAAVIAQRNVAMATMILVPVLATSLPPVGTLTARTKPALGAAFTMICGLAAAVGVLAVASEPTWGLGGYPTQSLTWVDTSSPTESPGRIATQEITGNLVGLLDGPTGEVFIDDRADMFPAEVFEDYVSLLGGSADWAGILDNHDIDVVVWERSKPLASLLASDQRWRMIFAEPGWAVACRRNTGVCEALEG